MSKTNVSMSPVDTLRGTLTAGTGTQKILNVSDYELLENKPLINSVEIIGDKSLEDYGIQPMGNYIEEDQVMTNLEIQAIIDSIML